MTSIPTQVISSEPSREPVHISVCYLTVKTTQPVFLTGERQQPKKRLQNITLLLRSTPV